MDPSIGPCILRDSFQPEQQYQGFVWKKFPLSVPTSAVVFAKSPSLPVHVDLDRYATLDALKRGFDSVDPKRFEQARDACNPFEGISRSIFSTRAGIKLANIDAITGLTGELFDNVNTTSDTPLVFADVASGPGCFTQYLHYRFPKSFGYGITLRGPLDCNPKFVDMSRFESFYGEKDTGDLYDYTLDFQTRVAEATGTGVGLLLADGGIEGFENQEYASSRLLTCQAFLGLTAVASGGNFLCKVFDTVNRYTVELLYCVCMCFEQVCIIKPVTSRPANSERYLVCKNRRDDIDAVVDIVEEAMNSYTLRKYLDSLLVVDSVPRTFVDWITKLNNQSVESQIEACTAISNYLRGKPPVATTQYSLHKFPMLWNVPG